MKFSRERILIKYIINKSSSFLDTEVIIKGWVQTVRKQTDIIFINMNDGSVINNIQVILSSEYYKSDINLIKNELNIGASISVKGMVIKSPANGQDIEIQAYECEIIGKVNIDSYPLPKTALTLEYLRQLPNFRMRRPIFTAINRIRNHASYSTHLFMKNNDFININTPLITSSDCEGAGETFTVSTLLKDKLSDLPIIDGKIDYSKDFFGKRVSLTVSGQLHAEASAHSLGDVYTFGPTFRSENSNTSRHLAEFWMLEIESCFMNLTQLMDFSEDYIKFIANEIINNNIEDLKFIEKSRKNECGNLIETLTNISTNDFQRLSYTDAINILEEDIGNYKIMIRSNYPEINDKEWKKKSKNKHIFMFKPFWGIDLASEHEKYLCEIKFKKPCIVYNYPKEIKAFYMKGNADNKTVQAMDILIPGIGELVGGSVRISDYDELIVKMNKTGINEENLSWYTDLRIHGNASSAGFGIGFERLLMMLTGCNNIRDCISFPRYPSTIIS